MGEVVGLRIGNYDFLSYKNTFGDLLSIFSKQDLKIEVRSLYVTLRSLYVNRAWSNEKLNSSSN